VKKKTANEIEIQAKTPKNREVEDPQFLQPELRFVASQQEAKPNRAGTQHRHHHTRELNS